MKKTFKKISVQADLAEEGIDGIAIQEEDDQLITASEAGLRHEANEK